MNSSTDLLLIAQHISVQFNRIRAVEHINFTLSKGEIIGLIGPNGAGKTTIFNLITGLYSNYSGDFLYQNQPLKKLSPRKIHQLGISRTFQHIRLFNDLSVFENIYATIISQHKKNNHSDYCHHLMELIGLANKKNLKASQLPYGEKRRLEIARALSSSPQLLLLDEPAAGMNDAEKTQLHQLITYINQKMKITIFMIEHDMRFISKSCQTLIAMDRGHILIQDQYINVINHPKVMSSYIGENYGTRRYAAN